MTRIDPKRRQRFRLLALIVAVAPGCAWTAVAQTEQPIPAEPAPIIVELDEEERARIQALHDEAVEVYRAGEYVEALEIWRRILELDPGDAIALYNAACAQIKLGQPEKAINLIEVAVLNGFVDFEDLRRDPDLDPIRDEPRFQALLGLIDEAYAGAAESMEAWSRETLGPDAIIERDDALRFIYATQLDRATHEDMRRIIARQSNWQIQHLFQEAPNSFVLLMVPRPDVADSLLRSMRLGGYYDHDRRQLVTREIGPSLRHEITHALHHAQMDRLGQKHPMWIQEGLASLFELYELDDAGILTALDNTRINIAINLARAGGLSDWRDFFAIDDRAFSSLRPRARYAEARAIFQFLADRDLLVEWYRTYLDNFEEDSTGARAFEISFGRELEEIEREFRLWVRGREKAPENVPDDEPALGLWVADQGANDGVYVVDVNPRGAARRARILPRDVILAIDGRRVYAVEELVYEVLRHDEGDEVTIRIRRGTQTREFTVELRPTPPIRVTELAQEPGIKV